MSKVYFRSERQSLRRMPKTGCICFTIRTYFHPVTEIVDEPGIPGRLAAAIRVRSFTVAFTSVFLIALGLAELAWSHSRGKREGIICRYDAPLAGRLAPDTNRYWHYQCGGQERPLSVLNCQKCFGSKRHELLSYQCQVEIRYLKQECLSLT